MIKIYNNSFHQSDAFGLYPWDISWYYTAKYTRVSLSSVTASDTWHSAVRINRKWEQEQEVGKAELNKNGN